MQSRLVPVDLLFVPGESASETSGVPLLPIVSHAPVIARWRAWIGSLRSLPLRKRPAVCRLTRDCLVLESGLKEACLAKALGRRWIRVDMPSGVCELWDSRSTRRLDAVVRETGRKEFYNPVLHARYRRARVSRPDSVRLDRIRRLLGDCGEGLRGLDIGCNMGYMSHMLQRQGFRMTGVDLNPHHLEVARALNDTYSLSVKFFQGRFEELEPSNGYDIVIMLTVLYHTLRRSEAQAARMVSRLDGLDPQALFWESGGLEDQPEREIDFIRERSGLTDYLSLGRTFGTKKRRELGVFLRPSTTLCGRFLERYKAESAGEFTFSHRVRDSPRGN